MVIGALPIGVAILFQVLSPGYIAPLFTTLTGKFMLATAVVLEVVGVLIIQRVLNIEV
jgi:tight adherence protein B